MHDAPQSWLHSLKNAKMLSQKAFEPFLNATALTRAGWQDVTHQPALGPLLPVNVACHQLPSTALNACDHAGVFCVGPGAIIKH